MKINQLHVLTFPLPRFILNPKIDQKVDSKKIYIFSGNN